MSVTEGSLFQQQREQREALAKELAKTEIKVELKPVAETKPFVPTEEYTYMESLLRQIRERIEAYKTTHIKERIEELTGEKIDLHVEMGRNFPRIRSRYVDANTEVFYWNNNTPEGIRIVTFVTMFTGDSFTITHH